MKEPEKKKRKTVPHKDDLLVRIFHENGGSKGYDKITEVYNEAMNFDFTREEVKQRMKNINYAAKQKAKGAEQAQVSIQNNNGGEMVTGKNAV